MHEIERTAEFWTSCAQQHEATRNAAGDFFHPLAASASPPAPPFLSPALRPPPQSRHRHWLGSASQPLLLCALWLHRSQLIMSTSPLRLSWTLRLPLARLAPFTAAATAVVDRRPNSRCSLSPARLPSSPSAARSLSTPTNVDVCSRSLATAADSGAGAGATVSSRTGDGQQPLCATRSAGFS
jgi:hypothetical protein